MDRLSPMTDSEVVAAVDGELQRARALRDGLVGEERATTYEYYLGQPFGNEVKGRSQVISQVVMEVIDSMMPDLMRVFCSGDKFVECTARRPEDVPLAEQATELCNHVLFTQNPGFQLVYEGIKSALLQKIGVYKYYWDESEEVSEQDYEGASLPQVAQLLEAEGAEIVAASPSAMTGAQAPNPLSQEAGMAGGLAGGMPAPMTFDVTIRTRKQASQVKIDYVPPDEFLFSARASSPDIQKCPMVAHEVRRTLSWLVENGVCDVETALSLPSGDSESPIGSEAEQLRRDRIESIAGDDSSADPMQREVVYSEVYQLLDVDGDGVSELRKICKVGDHIFSNTVAERSPFAVLLPKIMPGELLATSVADDVADLQLLKSTLWRMQMDALYQSLFPRMQVVESMMGPTTYSDLLAPTPGQPIRVKASGALTPLVTPDLSGQAAPMMEMVEMELEGRCPVNRQYQGLPDNAINKTATSAQIVSGRSQARMEMVARIMAETGFKELFRGILWLLGKHQDKAMTVRLTNGFMPIEPDAWRTEYDFTINVGLGLGNKAEQLQLLSTIAMAQAQAVQAGGMGLLITPKNIYNLQAKVASLSGFKDPEQFWTRPPDEFQPPEQPPPPQVQAAQINAQTSKEVEAMRAQQRQAEVAAKTAQDAQRAQQDAAAKRAELQLQLVLQRSNDERQALLDERKFKLDAMALQMEYAFKEWAELSKQQASAVGGEQQAAILARLDEIAAHFGARLDELQG